MPAKLSVEDLTPELRSKLKWRQPPLTKDAIKGYALRCMAPITELSKSNRARVLRMALKINEV